jgi:pepsin A
VFNIDPSQFQLEDNGNNNCTAIITGIDYDTPWWLVGQAWFQGKYVEFDARDAKDNKYVVGVAMLK